MTESLADWLLVQLAADEQVARGATPGPWRWDMNDGSFDGEPSGSGDWGHNGPDLVTDAAVEVDEYGCPERDVITSTGYDADHVIVKRADAAHIALWDPTRVLADIDAKRQQLDEHYEVHRDIGWLDDGDEASDELPVCGCCVPKHSHFRTRADVPIYPCRTVRLLALPFADRPGYREDWKP